MYTAECLTATDTGRRTAVQHQCHNILLALVEHISMLHYVVQLNSASILVAVGAGTLPESWGDEGSFPTLRVLIVQSGTKMSGSLPPGWGSPTAWQQLQYLYVVDCSVAGEY